MVKPALGRGLGALLGGVSAAAKPTPVLNSASPPPPPQSDVPSDAVRRVPLKQIRPCPFQPRKDFSEESIRELADSIREQGVIQPLIVRQKGNEFELIAGERRWRAAQLAGISEIPVMLREADDRAVLELALIENLQRENLNAMEEALGFSQLIEQFQLTQEEAAVRVGKSRAAVANSLRLLKLPPQVQARLRTGEISVGHAKVVLSLPSGVEQAAAVDKIVAASLNVRQTEELVTTWQKRSASVAPRLAGSAVANRDMHAADLENRLKERLATKVLLRYREGKGSIDIRFFSDAELERLLHIMGVAVD